MSEALNQFKQPLLIQLETEMKRYIEQHVQEKSLRESMIYSLEAGGKRIRPLLLFVTMASFKKEVDFGAVQVASALEMIHTYSLIHDDLPAMDDDDLRRGKPTNHKVYGEALAILAGDGLLTMAFQLLSQSQLANDKKLLLIQLLAETAGSSGMVAGQVADILGEGQSLSVEELIAIHQRKTGELIRFAVLAGGILADQSQQTIADLAQLSTHLGLAFQIRDDILDVISDQSVLGKATQKDELAEKNTYPGLLGLAGAKAALASEMNQSRAIIRTLEKEQRDVTLFEELLELFSLEEKGVKK